MFRSLRGGVVLPCVRDVVQVTCHGIQGVEQVGIWEIDVCVLFECFEVSQFLGPLVIFRIQSCRPSFLILTGFECKVRNVI